VESLANRYLRALLSCPPDPRPRAGYSFWQRYWASLTGTPLTRHPVQLASVQPQVRPGHAQEDRARFPWFSALRAGQQPERATSTPHAATNAELADSFVEISAWAPSVPKRRSYRPVLAAASATFATLIIAAVIVSAQTAYHTSVKSASTAPLAAAGASPIPIPSADPGPEKAYNTLLTKLPGNVQAQGTCRNVGTSVGAIAVSQCAGLQGLAAGTIYYYLFPDQKALNNGFSGFLGAERFTKYWECTKLGNVFVDFIALCESSFTNTTHAITGSVAEYANTANNPIIVSTDDRQLVMAVMVGTNGGTLLSYWKQFNWIAPVLQGKSVADVQAYARAAATEYGWGATQFACLRNLWTRDSSWRWDAQNGASGAYGIPQALPGSKMASFGADWQTNPATQVKWGLGYIKSADGTPCAAWTSENRNGYY
jgi:hypothetical protein